MIDGNFTIRIEMLENGFTVEVPDYEKAKELEAKREKESKGDKCCSPSPVWIGDCTDKMVAKTVKDVMDIVSKALSKLPQDSYAEAFEEATKSNRRGEPGGK
jgi:hypothetical protein